MDGTKDERKRKVFLWCSLVCNLGLLGFFKYYNFFAESFVEAFSTLGVELNPRTLSVILPVGISFYTFQTLSYTIDVYRGNLKATKNIVSFFTFVSFFPQLVAGPIERASNLLPQFYKDREFKYPVAVDGIRQVLWGLFKKVVIADNCAPLVDMIFTDYETMPSGLLALGSVLFAFQIYCDFSGYSDIAIGTAKLFGFDLMRNFAYPYFSRDIAEFWRRWHISLSTWFRDYLYIPLGGSRGGTAMKVRNTFAIFLVSGFWHGANWTFIAWGLLNAVYFLPLLLANRNRMNLGTVAENSFFPSIKELIQMLSTFAITCLAWIFFRAESIEQACNYIIKMFSMGTGDIPSKYLEVLPLLALLIIIEWVKRKELHPLVIDIHPRIIHWIIYILMSIMIIVYSSSEEMSFIYFQF